MDSHNDDDRWNYDCPQFIDFTVPMPFNDGADQMFEQAIIGEGVATSTEQFLAMTRQSNEAEAGASQEAGEKEEAGESRQEERMEEDEKKKEKTPRTEQTAKVIPEVRKLSNVCTSVSDWRSKGKHPSTGPDEGTERKKPCRVTDKSSSGVGAGAAPKSALGRSNSIRLPKSSSISNLVPDKSAGSGVKSALGRSNSIRLPKSGSVSNLVPEKSAGSGVKSALGRSNSIRLPKSGSVSDLSTDKSTDKSTDRGVPTASRYMRSRPIQRPEEKAGKVKSTELMEMEHIQQLKKELQQKRRLAQESYKKAKVGPMPVYSSKASTVPLEFHFQTDSRLKTQGEKAEDQVVGDFVKSLRSRTVSPGPSHSGQKKLTVPQPFHLTEKPSSSGKQQTVEGKFHSMAEQVSAFHKKTPDRFRARARSGGRARSISPPPKLTQPQTPNLTARGRHRAVHHPTQEQLEDDAVEEMKRSQFKANPVKRTVLTSSSSGLKKVSSKPVTQTEEFALTAPLPKRREEPERYEFHAKPLNKRMLEGPMGVKALKPAMPTVPQSPAFALKHRVRLPIEVPEEKPELSHVRAKPVPHTGIPFQPKLPHQHTVPEPFTVDERSKVMLAQREEKIRMVLEEEKRAREFHAQPLPSQAPGQLPERRPKERTQPEPFQLGTDQRGDLYLQQLAQQMEEDEEEQRRAVRFRAQPNSTIYKEPFIPNKSTKALTEVSDFELNSDRRAVQREEFELQKKEREAELEGVRRQREHRQREEEDAAIAKLRAEMVHRPNPVRRFSPMQVKSSDKPLTEPESPRFSDRLRAKVRL